MWNYPAATVQPETTDTFCPAGCCTVAPATIADCSMECFPTTHTLLAAHSFCSHDFFVVITVLVACNLPKLRIRFERISTHIPLVMTRASSVGRVPMCRPSLVESIQILWVHSHVSWSNPEAVCWTRSWCVQSRFLGSKAIESHVSRFKNYYILDLSIKTC